jgi:hypothetical protein
VLPAVSAVSTISAASATAAAVTASPTAATAASATVTTSTTTPPTTAASTLSLRPRLIDNQVPPAEILPVQRVDRAIGIFVALHFDEGEAARLARKTVTNQIDA